MPKRKNSTEEQNEKNEQKKSKSDESSMELGKLYGDILISAARTAFHDDSGCFYDVCQPYTKTIGEWKYIYQPTNDMKEMEDLVVAIIITRTDRKKITQTMFNKAMPYFQEAEDLYMKSYHDVLAFTKGKWTEEVDGSFEQIAKIRQPLTLTNGVIKMKYEIRGEMIRCDDWWYPSRLYTWLGLDTSHLPFDENGNMIGKLNDETGLPNEYYYMRVKVTEDTEENENDEE